MIEILLPAKEIFSSTAFFSFSLSFFKLIMQVNFVVCLASSFIVAIVLRVLLDYKSTSVTVRRVYSALFGILFCIICFEW